MVFQYEGVILLAHGARDARWMVPFENLAAELQVRLRPCVVALSFLDFAPPTFADAVATVRAGAAKKVLVVPLFLSGGGHVAKDIPALVAPVQASYPDMVFDTAGAVGEAPEVAEAMSAVVERLLRG